MRASTLLAATLLSAAGGSANAAELFAGAAFHAVDTPFTLETGEGGTDLIFGVRGGSINALGFIGRPAPYLLGVVNLEGDTSLVAAGLSWRFGDRLYVQPGIGLAIHDGPSRRFAANGDQTDLGSRILFEPEIAIGWRLSERLAAEASWIHVSHATLFNSGQNPGLDIIGARLVLALN